MKNRIIALPVLAAGLLGIVVGGLGVAVIRPNVNAPNVNAKSSTEIVRDALQSNPEAVLEALRAWRAQMAEKDLHQRRDAIRASRSQLFDDPNSPVLGNPKGDVTLVVFSDYRCPYCRQALGIIQSLVKSDSKLRLVYKEFPILGPQSVVAARLAVAARDDPRYSALHEALMTAPGALSVEPVLQIAADLGLDRAALAQAMTAPEVENILRANHALARTLGIQGTPAFIIGDLRANHALARTLGIQGTPAFIIGDTFAPGVLSLDDMKKLVARTRERGGDQLLTKWAAD